MTKLIIILPESIMGNKTYRSTREQLLNDYKVNGVFNLSERAFEAGTKGQILYFGNGNSTSIRLASVEEKGMREIALIAPEQVLKTTDLILIPNYWDNKKTVCEGYYSLTFQELMEEGIIETNKNGNLPSGDEIGSVNYCDDGEVPFIRTSDIANLEVKNNPTHYATETIYQKYRERQDIKPFDILFVRDGGKKVGDCAMVMEGGEKIIIQSHILKLRIKENQREINCWNFLYALYSRQTKEQISNLLFRLTIPSIANRVKELVLYFPKDRDKLLGNSRIMQELFQRRSELNNQLRTIFNQIDPRLVQVFPDKVKQTFNNWVEEQKDTVIRLRLCKYCKKDDDASKRICFWCRKCKECGEEFCHRVHCFAGSEWDDK